MKRTDVEIDEEFLDKVRHVVKLRSKRNVAIQFFGYRNASGLRTMLDGTKRYIPLMRYRSFMKKYRALLRARGEL